MSDSSRDNDSSGSLKSIRNRLQSKSSFDAADGIKKGLNHLSGITKNFGSTVQSMFSGKGEGSVYSKGTRELDDYGYEKYNLDDDCGEIFISMVPDDSFFNEGNPIFVRATGGNFVSGSSDNRSTSPAYVEPEGATGGDMFVNVVTGSKQETVYKATIGSVGEDGEFKPKPVNTDFLGRMRGSGNDRSTADSRARAEAVHDEPAAHDDEVFQSDAHDDSDSPRFLQIDDEVAEPIKVPEDMDRSFIDKITRTKAGEKSPQHIEFIIDPDEPETIGEAPEEAVADDAGDEYSWVEFEDIPGEADMEEPAPVVEVAPADVPSEEEPVIMAIPDAHEEVEDALVDVPADIPVEMPVEEPADVTADVAAPVEVAQDEPVVMAVSEEHVEAPEDSAEVSGDPVEMLVDAHEEVEDAPVDVPVEEPADVTTDVAVPVEVAQDNVVVPTLHGMDVEVEPIAGLDTEGSKPSSESNIIDNIVAKPTDTQGVPTGSASAEAPRFKGIDQDGEALPPLSDPVKIRPRSVRFRFSNGVLQNVDSNNKGEHQEELRDPLE